MSPLAVALVLSGCVVPSDTGTTEGDPNIEFVEEYCFDIAEPKLDCYCDGVCLGWISPAPPCEQYSEFEPEVDVPVYRYGEYLGYTVRDEFSPNWYVWTVSGEGVGLQLVNDEYTYTYCGGEPSPVAWFSSEGQSFDDVFGDGPTCEVSDIDDAVAPCD